jgi:hypothetical protein
MTLIIPGESDFRELNIVMPELNVPKSIDEIDPTVDDPIPIIFSAENLRKNSGDLILIDDLQWKEKYEILSAEHERQKDYIKEMEAQIVNLESEIDDLENYISEDKH